jgi:membrane-associated protease RseP (regulator of RpoE activity)
MRKQTIVGAGLGLALVTAVGVAGLVGAAPNAKPRAPSAAPKPVDLTPSTPGRGRLGFAALQISPELRAFFGAPPDRGVLVQEVKSDRPAAQAGLQVGDVVLEVDGAAVHSAREIIDALGDHKKGDVIALNVERGKHQMMLKATLVDDAVAMQPGMRHESGTLDDGTTWERFEGQIPPEMRELMGRMGGAPSDDATRHELDATRKRLDELEQRLDKLEHHS